MRLSSRTGNIGREAGSRPLSGGRPRAGLLALTLRLHEELVQELLWNESGRYRLLVTAIQRAGGAVALVANNAVERLAVLPLIEDLR